MRWFLLALFSLSLFGRGIASDESELFSETDEMVALESEIEAFLEEEMEEDCLLPSSEFEDPILPLRNSVSPVEVESIEVDTSLATDIDELVTQDEEEVAVTPASALDAIREETAKSVQTIEINLKQVFSGSPIIYLLLFFLSTTSVCIWLYSMLTIRSVDFLPPELIKELRGKLVSNQFDEALDLCVKQKHFFCKMLASGILARRHGLNVMIDTMKAEGKRSTVAFWQRINILNEIAVIAPMLGLLGTVLGMFYAFYDLNRSVESVSLLFDGLGISVGTTVAGLIVAILAMILYSVVKYRLVRILATVENEAQIFAALIDTRGQ